MTKQQITEVTTKLSTEMTAFETDRWNQYNAIEES